MSARAARPSGSDARLAKCRALRSSFERDDALGPELFLLRNQQHGLHLIVGCLLVLPECPSLPAAAARASSVSTIVKASASDDYRTRHSSSPSISSSATSTTALWMSMRNHFAEHLRGPARPAMSIRRLSTRRAEIRISRRSCPRATPAVLPRWRELGKQKCGAVAARARDGQVGGAARAASTDEDVLKGGITGFSSSRYTAVRRRR